MMFVLCKKTFFVFQVPDATRIAAAGRPIRQARRHKLPGTPSSV
ncbi:hypothetical protein L539_0643 [Bordetella hinzii 5132]|uniref:Uncharacterized protein n=1 Tax=Bordetella hinzii OH87 BAL007II TaxID=1331262 RepID=A0ABR4QX79_9BORD|nr:hypothetical protein L544_0617 [Bordetella hinzii OH87 BAL007II]KCB33704.1 hypothetical protein L543_0655 [Bordetella hinzii L60]KCB41854.1 hypothetical protein L539_0643 [Bordetella hinzii 5132]